MKKMIGGLPYFKTHNHTLVAIIMATTNATTNGTIVACDCSFPSFNNATEQTAAATVLKVLTVDWKAKDVVELMGPRFEKYKGGRVKVDVSTVPGFDTLFSEIENDARLGLGLFDVCE